MSEPCITINGVTLTTGQAMTVCVALELFAFSLTGEGMGDDEQGRAMTQGYLNAIREIHRLMFPQAGIIP